ncbi:MAG: DUF6484 domain-containing protein [Byssovorax sp.]
MGQHREPLANDVDAPAIEAPAPAPSGESLVELVLAEHAAHAERAPSPPARIHGVVIGQLAGLGPAGQPLVDFPQNPGAEPRPARSTVPVGAAEQGRAVALMFEEGDPARPLLIGLIHEPAPPVVASGESAEAAPSLPQDLSVEADGQKVVLSAEKELVLRCGKASITLTQAGKILIRGAYVLTRSSGVNRIQGGSVQIN